MALSFRRRTRGNSLSTVPPTLDSVEYSIELAQIASRILYKSPLPSQADLPVYVLNSAAFPDANEINYDALLPYVLSRFPTDDQLIGGKGYEIVFFAGGQGRDSSLPKKHRPGVTWFLQAYQILSRAMRKRLQKLYLVHEKRWIRVMSEMFSTVVSPKFRRKVVHLSSLSGLALHIPIEDLLIPPSAYDCDRLRSPDIYVPYASGRRAFGATNPLPISSSGRPRLPRVLRETSSFILLAHNIGTEGIFRINSRALTLNILKEAFERGQKFIVWREGDCVMSSSHWKEGSGEVVIDELAQHDGYGVYTAAGLIKLWYSNLREPIFPDDSYAFIERVYGNPKNEIEIPVLLDLISINADWSPMSRMARLILTMHLFPLLARIAAHSDRNKMTSHNLAVCFAPSLLCGPDPVMDAKVSGTVSRIIEFGIDHWESSLAKAFDMSGTNFENSLMRPDSLQDMEDPLDSLSAVSPTRMNQIEGIVLVDNEGISDSDEELEKPPLPPRVNNMVPLHAEHLDSSTIKRKPVPPSSELPPRYSTIVDTNKAFQQRLSDNEPLVSNSTTSPKPTSIISSQALQPTDASITKIPLPPTTSIE